MSSEKIERLRKELADAELEDEIENARCPLCGEKLTFLCEDRDTDGGEGARIQHFVIKCEHCNTFGVDNTERYNILDVVHGRQTKPINVMHEWNHLKKYLKGNDDSQKIQKLKETLETKLNEYEYMAHQFDSPGNGTLYKEYCCKCREIEWILEFIKKL